MSNPGAVYTDGDYTIAQSCSLPVFSCPIPGVNEPYQLKQDWVQLQANYSPLALNTPYPASEDATLNAAGYILMEENNFRDLGSGVLQWTRTYWQIPAQHSSPGSIAYNFIGWADTFLLPVIYRQRFTRTVPCTSVYDYFLSASAGTTDIESVINGNFVQEQLYTWPRITGFPTPPEDQATDYITNTSSPATIPTLTDYVNWANAGTHPIDALPSQFDRVIGNIIRRTRSIIQPQ